MPWCSMASPWSTSSIGCRGGPIGRPDRADQSRKGDPGPRADRGSRPHLQNCADETRGDGYRPSLVVQLPPFVGMLEPVLLGRLASPSDRPPRRVLGPTCGRAACPWGSVMGDPGSLGHRHAGGIEFAELAPIRVATFADAFAPDCASLK